MYYSILFALWIVVREGGGGSCGLWAPACGWEQGVLLFAVVASCICGCREWKYFGIGYVLVVLHHDVRKGNFP